MIGIRISTLLAVASALACARQAAVSPAANPTFTGATCEANRVGAAYGNGWVEARSDDLTYCVPTNFTPDARARFWKASFARFSWGDDARVTGPNKLVPFASSNDMYSMTDHFDEDVDGHRLRLRVMHQRDDFYVQAQFDDDGPKLAGRAAKREDADLLIAICRSVRFR